MEKIERFNPEFFPKEIEALYDFLDNECELPEDDSHYILTKKEFMELGAYEDDHFDMEYDSEIEAAAYFASMLERIRDLRDEDVLEIDMSDF